MYINLSTIVLTLNIPGNFLPGSRSLQLDLPGASSYSLGITWMYSYQLGREGTLDCYLHQSPKFYNNNFFFLSLPKVFRAHFSWKGGDTLPQIVKNLNRTHEKLHCKGEPYYFIGQRDPSVQTELLLYKEQLPYFHLPLCPF